MEDKDKIAYVDWLLRFPVIGSFEDCEKCPFEINSVDCYIDGTGGKMDDCHVGVAIYNLRLWRENLKANNDKDGDA